MGREFWLEPDNNHALSVDLKRSPFFLTTDPPGYPGEELKRFTTGDRRFDNLFPIRYSEQKLSSFIENNDEQKKFILFPFYWFLDRWEGKLGKMTIDWSGIHIHLLPGHEESFINPVRYLKPEEIEPLLYDIMALAGAIKDVAAGKKPELE